MLTVMVHAKIKQEMVNAYLDLIEMLVKETKKKRVSFLCF